MLRFRLNVEVGGTSAPHVLLRATRVKDFIDGNKVIILQYVTCGFRCYFKGEKMDGQSKCRIQKKTIK